MEVKGLLERMPVWDDAKDFWYVSSSAEALGASSNPPCCALMPSFNERDERRSAIGGRIGVGLAMCLGCGT